MPCVTSNTSGLPDILNESIRDFQVPSNGPWANAIAGISSNSPTGNFKTPLLLGYCVRRRILLFLPPCRSPGTATLAAELLEYGAQRWRQRRAETFLAAALGPDE